MKTCFFIGHRNAPSEIMPALCESIEWHIAEYGVTHFVVGHYGSFDSMAAQAVCEAKRQRNISLHLQCMKNALITTPKANKSLTNLLKD